MQIEISGDTILLHDERGSPRELGIGTPEAFQLLSRLWLRSGWDNKYVYSFTWLGRPVIQLPEDMLRIQEVLYRVKPDVLIETGIAKGRKMTSYKSIKTDVINAGAKWEDSEVVVDNGVITSRNPGDLNAFSAKIIEEINEGRHASRSAA